MQKKRLLHSLMTVLILTANLQAADLSVPTGPATNATGLTGNAEYDNGKISEILFTQFSIPAEDKTLDSDGLLKKGLSVLGQVQTKSKNLDTGKINYNSSDVHKALDYIIPSALSGNLLAGSIAIDLLQGYSMYQNKHDWVFKIAKVLHEKRSIKGTYHLAIAYKNGLAVSPNYDMAKILFGQVAAVCKTNREGTDAILGGKIGCAQAIANYDNLKSIGKQDFDTKAGQEAYKSAVQQGQLRQVFRQQASETAQKANLIQNQPAGR